MKAFFIGPSLSRSLGTPGNLGAYNAFKKDVLIMLRNEPLMFVQGPPVFIRVVVKDEESTSVFVENQDDLGVVGEADKIVQRRQEVLEIPEKREISKVANPSIPRKIHYLGTPFARQVYRPLQFVLGDETIKGTIQKIDGETLIIEMTEGEKEFVAVEIGKIDEILWRGDPFAES